MERHIHCTQIIVYINGHLPCINTIKASLTLSQYQQASIEQVYDITRYSYHIPLYLWKSNNQHGLNLSRQDKTFGRRVLSHSADCNQLAI